MTRQVTNEGLEQGYCVVPSAKRFILLYSFLKRYLSKKVMVFFSSCDSVKFHSELLRYAHVPCFDLHGKQKQKKRTSTISEFSEAESGILLCTDVAGRGLDIPAVVCFFPFLSFLDYIVVLIYFNLRSSAMEVLLKIDSSKTRTNFITCLI